MCVFIFWGEKEKEKNQWCSQQEVGRVFFVVVVFFNIKIGLLGRIAFKNVLWLAFLGIIPNLNGCNSLSFQKIRVV